ncbi:MAG: CDP-alcohol phosphatidyltransferase family protein [Candidatus Lokiarchaeia archaeon]|nr:CDP-alcohol phosphatidyltransferase family protein [Candidatus Lokiarchaeia archaeon]
MSESTETKIPKLLLLKDYITLIGTTFGIVALICGFIGAIEFISLGFFLITVSLGTDMIDGYIARKTKTVNAMGRELDSLSDSLTFGIVPGILTYLAFKTDTIFDIFIIIGAIFFAIGAMLRLARFNIIESLGYTGLPTPISALLMITYFYANYFFSMATGSFLLGASYVIPFLMILIGWFNITTYLRFGAKDRGTYILFLIIIPLCPIFGIIGISSPNFLTSIICSIIFLGFFLILMFFIIRGFIQYHMSKKKTSADD